MSDYGSDCNSIGSPHILSEKYCNVAVEALEYKMLSDDDCFSKMFPKGCSVSSAWEGACFNNAENGVIKKDFQSICLNNYGNI